MYLPLTWVAMLSMVGVDPKQLRINHLRGGDRKPAEGDVQVVNEFDVEAFAYIVAKRETDALLSSRAWAD